VISALPPIAFVLLWSSGYVVGKLAVQAAAPLGLLVIRFLLALVVVTPLALRAREWRRAPLGRLALIGVLLQGVQFAGVYGGLSLGVPAALSSLICLGLSPLATTVLATAAKMERPPTRTWVALGVGLAGVTLSVLPTLGSARVGAGLGLTVAGMLGLSCATVLQRRWAGLAGPSTSVAVQLVAALALTVPLATLTGELHAHPSAKLAWTVVWLAGPLSIGATGLFIFLLRRHEASTIATLLLAVPAMTAILSAVTLGESLHPLSLVGMAITLPAVLSVVRPRAQSARADGPGRPTRSCDQRADPQGPRRRARDASPRGSARPVPVRRA
jgi:drug/metabolite transporter (DMT)-like permease